MSDGYMTIGFKFLARTFIQLKDGSTLFLKDDYDSLSKQLRDETKKDVIVHVAYVFKKQQITVAKKYIYDYGLK